MAKFSQPRAPRPLLLYGLDVGRFETLSREARAVLTVVVTSVAVVVLLLNGACGHGPSVYHCYRPGICYEVSSPESCASNESSGSEGCSSLMRVGSCVAPDGHDVHLYAPLHGLLPPDCDAYTGPGSTYRPD